jgi:CubicO group peptidase (beta-lactamase class C family)
MRKWVIATLVILIAMPALAWSPVRALRVLTGLTSHTLCSAVFVSGLDPEQTYADNIKARPTVGLVYWAIRYHIDRERKEVRTTFLGGFEQRAVFHPGFGCTMNAPPAGNGYRPTVERIADAPITDSRLTAALDRAFAETDHPPHRRTRAIVVMHNGKIVAERYAPGYSAATPLHSWSLNKSLTNALLGVLVRQGRISMDQPAPVAAWADPNDPRHQITLDNLLRMSSGLAFEETGTGFDPEARMLFLEPDMAAFVERSNLKEKPGVRWEYTSGNTLILCRMIRDMVGGHADDVLAFAHHEVLGPLGMKSVTLEFDQSGTQVGSSFMYATARDWARFGELYANDGVIDGERILPEGWVQYSSGSRQGAHYGAGFWTAVGMSDSWGMPPGSFWASGILGQKIVIVQSEHLVVARFANTFLPEMRDNREVGQFVSDVVAALH